MTFEQKEAVLALQKGFPNGRVKIGGELALKTSLPAIVFMAIIYFLWQGVFPVAAVLVFLALIPLRATLGSAIARREFDLTTNSSFWWSLTWRATLGFFGGAVVANIVTFLLIIVLHTGVLQSFYIMATVYFAMDTFVLAWAAIDAYCISANVISDEGAVSAEQPPQA